MQGPLHCLSQNLSETAHILGQKRETSMEIDDSTRRNLSKLCSCLEATFAHSLQIDTTSLTITDDIITISCPKGGGIRWQIMSLMQLSFWNATDLLNSSHNKNVPMHDTSLISRHWVCIINNYNEWDMYMYIYICTD